MKRIQLAKRREQAAARRSGVTGRATIRERVDRPCSRQQAEMLLRR